MVTLSQSQFESRQYLDVLQFLDAGVIVINN